MTPHPDIAEVLDGRPPVAPLPFRLGGWPCIYADPPWEERGAGKIKRGADRHYALMPTRDICAMPVASVAAESAHLWLWVTNNFLEDGLEVMRAWGFRYVTCATWAKDRVGLGYYLRGQTEQLLFGVRGETQRLGQGSTLITAPRGRHSAKPVEARQLVERVSPGPRLELFAREAAPGWTAWGNQAPNVVRLDVRLCWCGAPGEPPEIDGVWPCATCRAARVALPAPEVGP